MILLYNHQFQYQETHTQSIMTPVTRQPASSIHVASQASRYDYLNAAKKNLETTEQQQQQDYDQECFEEQGGDDACISTRRTTRNSKVKQQQQPTAPPSKKTVAFVPQQAPAPAQQQKHEEQPTGKRVSKRQAAKYDAHKEAVEAANILASLAAAAAAASGPKERTPPYWTRQHEKAKSGARLQKSSVLQCD
jgi:hypothetical protein